MASKNHSFVAWEEHVICQERGSRVVHFYLKDELGHSVLAVIGTERSIRHMMYVLSDDFLQAYGSLGLINLRTKWRARREVEKWLQSLVSKNHHLLVKDLESHEVSVTGPVACQTHLQDQMELRKLKAQNSDIEWSGDAWTCTKQLKHYPAFCSEGDTIAVHSFVFIMAEEESHCLGYLEDMYENRKGQKKVKVRWFHHNREVETVISQLNPHPREVFITPHVQVISARCINGLATVLTPMHYEKCLAAFPQTSPSGLYMCFRQFKNNKVKPFNLTKLRGYCNQAILSSIDGPLLFDQKFKCHKYNEEDDGGLTDNHPLRINAKRNRNCKGREGQESGFGVGNSVPEDQEMRCEPVYPKLKLRFSRKRLDVATEPPCPLYLRVDEKIELLCQDSGIRGCWFRCKILRVSQKLLKVQYDDVQDADETGNLVEWVPASRVAEPDKLGMRCPGRLTIRPCPPKVPGDCKVNVGTPVDIWWSDGWWEGVVTGVGISSSDQLQVYLPGEDKQLTVQRENARSSKDWVCNRWVDIKERPDIVSYLSANVSSSLKSLTFSAAVASGCGSTASVEHKVPAIARLEAVKEDEGELLGSSEPFELQDLGEINLNKGPCVSNEDERNECGGGLDYEQDDGNEKVLVLEEDIESVNKKCKVLTL